ncbi:MAG: exodeoxyribonuclease III [Alphaproteobacteria bacterium CG_4_10_14_0_8_um_filter_53_9]|nr:MAG: exodeoxyribonuclease III [Alphaproteobacteria bacterium CG_4_10_14_0_8_um_filter_53_9]
MKKALFYLAFRGGPCYPAAMIWSVATWNINSLRLRLPQVLAWLEEEKPTVLLLQETKVPDDLFPREAFEEAGWHVAFHGQKSYNGVAILSRYPLEDVQQGFGGEVLEEQARLLTATVKLKGAAPVRVASLYLPNGNSVGSEKFEWKRRFVTRLKEWMAQELAAHPRFVVGGDYNISADERDVDDPEKRGKECMFTPEERGWMHAFAEMGMKDGFREISDEAGVFSWWDYRMLSFEKNKGMRIDYNLISAPLAACVKEVKHARNIRKNTQPSDHVPVLTILEE